MGELHNGDRPSGAQIARHLERASAALPKGVERVYARADSGFYCCEAVEAYERRGWQFIISARKTARLVDELKAAEWKPSPRTDADGQCEFRYEPEGWGKPYRFIALRYEKQPRPREAGEPEQYQLFETADYRYRVFVTNLKHAVDLLVWFYNQRAGAENLIKEANNDAGLAAYPSARWPMNCNHFQLAMLAYNLGGRPEAHDLGDLAVALPVSGGQDLATRGPGGGELQRSLCGAWNLPAPDGAVASDHGEREGLRPGASRGAPLLRIERA